MAATEVLGATGDAAAARALVAEQEDAIRREVDRAPELPATAIDMIRSAGFASRGST